MELPVSWQCRGVQYVHWVMHKCIMVKVGGGNTRKVCKKLVNFFKTEGKFVKVGGSNNFRQSGGKCTKTGKIGGETQNLWLTTKKKRSSEIFADENRKFFREKVKFLK